MSVADGRLPLGVNPQGQALAIADTLRATKPDSSICC